MEIGRKVLTDEEFTKLWTELYREFHNLSTFYKCDAILVYNNFYKICTSDLSLEEKLYWKIGDFFLNRCKAHKERIRGKENVTGDITVNVTGGVIESGIGTGVWNGIGHSYNGGNDEFRLINDNRSTNEAVGDTIPVTVPAKHRYLIEYIANFKEFDRLVDNIYCLGTSISGSNRGKNLKDFGHLIWERIVIRNLKPSFLNDVFDYAGHERHVILESFQKINPDEKCPFMYYKANYEKVALDKITIKYKVSNIYNWEEFYRGIKYIVEFETKSMQSTFLPESYEVVKETLEECFFGTRYYEILSNLIEFMKFNNADRVRRVISQSEKTGLNGKVELNNKLEVNGPINGKNESNQMESNSTGDLRLNNRNSKAGFVYQRIGDEDQLRRSLETELDDYKPIAMMMGLINKREPVKIPDASEDNRNAPMLPATSESFRVIMHCFGCISAGYTILKKAYALYVNTVIKDNFGILEGSLENVIAFYDTLNFFGDRDTAIILTTVFIDHIQRAKPCFMQRLCDHTDLLISKFNTLDLNDGANKVEYNVITGQSTHLNGLNQSSHLSAEGNKLSNSKPFDSASMDLLRPSYNLIGDKNEFLNMYQEVLRRRLLANGNPNCYREFIILKVIRMPPQSKLYKMIEEIDHARINMNSLKIVSSHNWNIEQEHPNFPMPIELLRRMCLERKDLTVIDKDRASARPPMTGQFAGVMVDGLHYNKIFHGRMQPALPREDESPIGRRPYPGLPYNDIDPGLIALHRKIEENRQRLLQEVKKRQEEENEIDRIDCFGPQGDNALIKCILKISPPNTQAKSLSMAYKYCKVKISIDSKIITCNIYQYGMICLLMESPLNLPEISNKLCLPEKFTEKIIESLMAAGIIKKEATSAGSIIRPFKSEESVLYKIDCIGIQESDISHMKKNTMEEREICVDSYLQTVVAKTLKAKKQVEMEWLFNEMKMLSKIEVTDKLISTAVEKLIEKGILESKGTSIEFVN